MKLKKALFSLLTASLALGTSLALSSNKSVKTTKAAISDGVLCAKITDISQLTNGCTVYIGSYGRLMGDLCGNPVYIEAYSVPGESNDGSKLYFSYSQNTVIPMVVEIGSGTYTDLEDVEHTVTTYRFKSVKESQYEEDYLYPTRNKYLSYGHDYKEDGHDTWAHGDVSFRKANNEYSNWRVSIDSNGDAHLQYLTEKYDTEIRYFTQSARKHFGYYNSWSSIQIYRVVNTGSASVVETQSQDQQTVLDGDILDLSGLELKISDGDFVFYSTYDNEPHFYTINYAVYHEGMQGVVYYDYCGINYRALVDIIPETAEVTYYDKLSGPRGDYRGTYVLGSAVSWWSINCTYIAGTSIENVHDMSDYEYYQTIKPFDVDYSEQTVNTGDACVGANEYTIRRKTVGNFSYMFLCANDGVNVLYNDNGLPGLTNSLSATAAITIDQEMNVCIDGQKLVFNANRTMFVFTSNPDSDCFKVSLFKKVKNASDEAASFVTSFGNLTHNACTLDGTSAPNMSAQDWGAQASAFEALTADAQGYLANLTYYHNGETLGSAADIVDRYDYIVSKYNQYDDFMHRGDAGTLLDFHYVAPSERLNIFNKSIDNTSVVVIIAVTISITLIASLVIIKKKKKQ